MASTPSKEFRLQFSTVNVEEHFHQPPATSADDTLRALIETYDAKKLPVEVNFRQLSPIKPGEDRLTHLLHSYPAVASQYPIIFSQLQVIDLK